MPQSPQILAQLSRVPLNGDNQIRAADVYSVVGPEKKKRTELAVAIDQEGIQIFDLRQSKAVTSYAVPALTSFTCPPLSLRRKHNSLVQRMTYVSANNQIQCFVENSGKNVKNDERIVRYSYKLDEKSQVKFLDSYAGGGDGGLNLLAIHENGVIRFLSEDLSVQYWATNPLLADCIVHAELSTTDQAMQGILKSRPDVVASLSPAATSGSTKTNSALILLTQTTEEADQSQKSLEFKVFRLGASSYGIDGLRHRSVFTAPEEVLSISLPGSQTKRSESSKYTIHKHTGRLYEHGDNLLAIYDLSGLTPRLEQLHQFDSGLESSIRLSSTTAAYTTATTLVLLDTQFASVQASGNLRTSIETFPQKGEQVEKHDDSLPATHLLSYFSSLDLIVALQGRVLLTFHLGETGLENEHARKRIKRGTLADAVGRGLAAKNFHHGVHGDSTIPSDIGSRIQTDVLQSKWESKLKKYIKRRNAEAFDTYVNEEISLGPSNPHNPNAVHQTGVLRGLSKTYYVLGKLFRVHRQGNPPGSNTRLSLTLEILPPNTFRWLVLNDFMTVYHVEASLKRNKSLQLTEKLPVNCLMQTLAAFDKTLQTLMFVLAAPQPLTAREIVCAIRHALLVLEQSRNLATMKLIESGPPDTGEGSDQGMEITNGDAGNETGEPRSAADSDEDMETMGSEVDNESSSPEEDADKVHDANAVLRTCLLKLSIYHDSDIRKAFKHELTTAEIISFVHHLRTELAGGGWLSRYSDDLELEDQQNDFPNQISVVAKLLDCAIDALGSGAWLHGARNLHLDIDTNADTLAFMQAEVSAALQGMEESTYLRGILQEFLTYSARLPEVSRKTPSHIPSSKRSRLVLDVQGNGDFNESSALPLGLKPQAHVDTTVNLLDGRVKERSRREYAHLKRMKVPAYSLDKILI